jgi:3-hydroxyacyl-CoA dehydrogenase/3-hydroxy-2-methylbutyryl-CoA dehydrogenase
MFAPNCAWQKLQEKSSPTSSSISYAMAPSSILGKVFFVTGAAQGLGRATAVRLGSLGAKVCVVDRSAEAADAVAKEIGDNALALVADVADEEHMKAAVAKAIDKFGKINGTVNCAGVAIAAKTLSKKGAHPLDSFAKVINVNVVGTFNSIRLTAEAMSKNSPDADGARGVIINTASIAAFDGQMGQVAYAASKGAVAAMTLPIARDLASTGIRVCTIAPGLFKTPMLAGLPEQVQTELASTVPFPKRLGNPDEYAQLVQSIIENPMLNGEIIRLDGALRMQP